MTNFTDPNEMPREMEFYTYDEFKHLLIVVQTLLLLLNI